MAVSAREATGVDGRVAAEGSPDNKEKEMQKKQTELPVKANAPKGYVKPELTAHGSLAERTLNSNSGADPEGFEDNIVWGN
ncbi:MAG TPA: hypothetical protein VNT81_13905 [Vicinamibacterales bacterium]|nr:hypothetical protein [Vicinamibacterales bacterium]